MKKGYTATKRKARENRTTSPPGFTEIIVDKLEQLAREVAERMLAEMLEVEVSEFLQRVRYQRNPTFRGHRNGYAPERTVGVGLGALKVQMPRVSHVPKEVAARGFQSQIVSRYQRISRTTQRLLAQLYLEGLSTGDFEPVFRALLGENAPLSPNSVVRLKQEWQREYEAWRRRPLDGHQYLYVWADGVYLSAGPETEKLALLCVLGLREDGQKELLAMLPGYRESTESWTEVLRDLKQRGMKRPLAAVGDGALGIWAAMREVWPESRPQRCWNHRSMNVLDKLPKRLWPQVKKDLRKAAQATTRADCLRQLGGIAPRRRGARNGPAALREAGQERAAETVLRDVEDFLTFYDFPQEHWIHLRTTNPVESIFAGIRLRTNVAKRLPNPDNALYLVFKVAGRLSQRWRRITGSNLCQLVLDGKRFVDGKLVELVAA
ncbi:MAG TPA: IS256 family transposase [Dehalococcoidia bacterium]|nr:IS256 family transposase [Dehalococcoidia bacterium]